LQENPGIDGGQQRLIVNSYISDDVRITDSSSDSTSTVAPAVSLACPASLRRDAARRWRGVTLAALDPSQTPR
jgi:hypothetical protein